MIIRTYECMDCQQQFEWQCESGNDGDPDCPNCAQVMEWRPQMFATRSAVSKGVDITQEILENDFGLTDFNDNLREGDVTAKSPPPNKELAEAQARMIDEAKTVASQASNPDQIMKNVNTFFNSGAQAAPPGLMERALADARGSKGQGVDAMAALHELGRRGELPTRVIPVGRAPLD